MKLALQCLEQGFSPQTQQNPYNCIYHPRKEYWYPLPPDAGTQDCPVPHTFCGSDLQSHIDERGGWATSTVQIWGPTCSLVSPFSHQVFRWQQMWLQIWLQLLHRILLRVLGMGSFVTIHRLTSSLEGQNDIRFFLKGFSSVSPTSRMCLTDYSHSDNSCRCWAPVIKSHRRSRA